jgi:asparagine synthase (glutamine-hydrolysing)
MCGLALILDPAAPPELGDRLRRMHAPIRHRGPDGEGFLGLRKDGAPVRAESAGALAGGGFTLGVAFRRLRIQDLSEAAAQPMASPDGRRFIVFNGEIYNFRALRDELRARGREFRTTGDTEVLLAAYEAWGERCFERLDGMWALAIADLQRGRLVLSRDRFGIKPLHWALGEDGALLVASEAKQVVAAREGKARANGPLVARFLAGSRYPCLEETFFEGVYPVPPATWCEVPLSGPPAAPRFAPYWSLSDFHHDGTASEADYAASLQRFGVLLRDAVRSHTVADVRAGSLLSGGLDSSALTALLGPAARESGRDWPTFSFGVRDGAPRLNELPYAEAVARAHGLENHQAGLDADWVRRHAGEVVRTLDEPPLALPAFAQYRIFQLCREHGVTVVLDGQGADEVLGGYPYHQRLLLLDRLRRGRVGAARRELSAIGRREHVSRLRLLGALALPPLRSRLRRRPRWLAVDGHGPRDAEARRARADRGRDPSALNRQLYWDVKWGNVKIVLGYTDRNAMAHSVEARVPYFDRALVEFAFTLPDHFKVGDGQRKRILRDTARALLPAEVTERPDRMGFALEAAPVVRALLPGARAVLAETRLLSAPWIEARETEAMLARFAGGDDGAADAVWRLFALAVWAREFDVALA